MKKKSTTLLRLAMALLIFGAIVSGLVPGLTTSAQADPSATGACNPNTCLHAGVCQACPNGQERLCFTKVCCGVTTITSCNPCNGCALPPG
ncbi:MAG TPA: hypothetical protein VIE43_13210 [Thermoanaerobaculia bacterium]|jgi:hypothetical protein|nr:hypothetical protein [Thermoanaerobaculia bacterium]